MLWSGVWVHRILLDFKSGTGSKSSNHTDVSTDETTVCSSFSNQQWSFGLIAVLVDEGKAGVLSPVFSFLITLGWRTECVQLKRNITFLYTWTTINFWIRNGSSKCSLLSHWVKLPLRPKCKWHTDNASWKLEGLGNILTGWHLLVLWVFKCSTIQHWRRELPFH